ncbi:condensin-2 complex subunit H2 isoform X3 [Molossus molossus]|uniref:condensin-2 complex subunit H2 isoform X3 n=1 Tax=Molossus molossus TaxID=27622 RepID=UPI001747ADB5|nr:condensin-2 complex subunit H2 isoform X3 [Molossus molossus]
MEDVEARFAHLLQPIRDLTKNWEVDVAAQLGEYLEELDQICISFDEGKTTMNFVEAALLIQGSACVYSKKVEYLYSLVYQALDFISGKRQARQLSAQEDGAIRDASSRASRQVEDEFLSLDDLPDTRANVDLRSEQCPSEVVIVPLLPMALVALDEMEKNNNPLYSCQGEVLASRKDFRMNTCTPHPRGAFMLEPVGLSPMETLLPRRGEGSGVGPGEAERAEEQPMEVSVIRSPVPVPSISQEPGTSPEGPRPGHGGEDEDDAEGAAELPEAEAPEVPLEPQEPRSPQQSTAQPRRFDLRERPEALEPVSQLKETPDPWQSLDPFNSLDSKPFKKGRPYSVPACVEEAPGQKRKRKGATKLQDFHQWCLATYADHADGRRPRRKGPSFADMEVLYWTHVKEQLETLRKLQRREVAKRWLPRAEEGLWPVEEDRLEDSLQELGAADDFLEPEEYAEPDGAKLGEAADLDMEVLYWTHVKEQLETLGKLQRREVAKRWLPRAEEGLWPVEEDRLEDSLQELGAAADDFLEPEEYAEPDGAKLGEAADLAEAIPASLSYEELVRRNVELFITTSQKFVQETELSQRVRDWEDSIQPLLQEQEQHMPFDIHIYGDQMVSRFSQLNQWCPFATLVAGQPAFEVCRAMLASLQLANDHTVEITQQPGLEAAVDTMSLRLLTHQQAHKRFQTYAAPSMAQP